jgi:hypothetical protein
MTRTLAWRLNKLEEQLKPGAEPKVWQVVIVHPDGRRELERLIEWSPTRSGRLGARSE